MTTRAADNSEPNALADMLAIDQEAMRLWEPQELAGLLRHQLAAPLEFDLTDAGTASIEDVTRLSQSPERSIRTFGDLLHHPAPPIQLLTFVKDFAKASRQDPKAALPKEITAVLYFASIVVAQQRCGRRISKLEEPELRAGVQWVLEQPWVDADTRSLFEAPPGDDGES
jgi:hypothetical protein